jgi:hypothetical protein
MTVTTATIFRVSDRRPMRRRAGERAVAHHPGETGADVVMVMASSLERRREMWSERKRPEGLLGGRQNGVQKDRTSRRDR